MAIRVMHVVGARPNFMKVAPIMHAMDGRPDEFEQVLVHTGQHYDFSMSDVFFEHLGMRDPDICLNVHAGTHAEQTARIMLGFEQAVLDAKPAWVVVVGDVNSTMACALVSSKLGIPVAHVEAGLRSGDRSMPEEINRIITDQLSDILFTPSADADENLVREGIAEEKIYRVGNVIIDSLIRLLPVARERRIARRLQFDDRSYILVTLHRPGNVDNADVLAEILRGLASSSELLPVVFPVHPRTRQRLMALTAYLSGARVHLIEPQGYLDFLSLLDSARIVITDSGGVQEETCYLGISCLTVRPNTERPVTIASGTNRLVAANADAILKAVESSLNSNGFARSVPAYWDGLAASRIADVFRKPESRRPSAHLTQNAAAAS